MMAFFRFMVSFGFHVTCCSLIYSGVICNRNDQFIGPNIGKVTSHHTKNKCSIGDTMGNPERIESRWLGLYSTGLSVVRWLTKVV